MFALRCYSLRRVRIVLPSRCCFRATHTRRVQSRTRDESKPPRAETGRKKRKMAFYVSYLGTDFHGSSASDKVTCDGTVKRRLASDPVEYDADGVELRYTNEDVETVESAVLTAMHACGYVKAETAREEPKKKMNWSAMSRTDKGVHAQGHVMAAKMELTPAELQPPHAGVAAALNARLPPSIRVSRSEESRSAPAMRKCSPMYSHNVSVTARLPIHEIYMRHTGVGRRPRRVFVSRARAL